MDYKSADLILDDKTHKIYNCDFTPEKDAKLNAKALKWKKGPIIDPTCGSGNLLKAALEIYSKSGLKPEMCYGIDILKENIECCLNDSELAGCHFQMGNVFEDDFTDPDWWKKDPLETFEEFKIRTGFKPGFFGKIPNKKSNIKQKKSTKKSSTNKKLSTSKSGFILK